MGQCVEEALQLHSAVYTRTVEAGRTLCQSMTEPECQKRLQTEVQALEETWGRALSQLGNRKAIINTTVQVTLYSSLCCYSFQIFRLRTKLIKCISLLVLKHEWWESRLWHDPYTALDPTYTHTQPVALAKPPCQEDQRTAANVSIIRIEKALPTTVVCVFLSSHFISILCSVFCTVQPSADLHWCNNGLYKQHMYSNGREAELCSLQHECLGVRRGHMKLC